MTVKELIEYLQQCNPSDLVVLSRDAEGNGYSPLESYSEDLYVAESSWYGETCLRELTPELVAQGYTSEDVGSIEDGAIPCVTLAPVN